MKTISKLTMMAAMLLVALITSCGKDGGSTGGGDAYIPDIGQQWLKLNTTTEKYNFNYLGSPTSVTGTFNGGAKTVNGTYGDGGTISGSFNHSQIDFIVELNGVKTSYSGKVSGSPSNKMILNNGNLTLTKP